MIRKYLLVVIILFVGFSGFTQAEVEVNEVKINDLKDELRQLDALLSKHKEQEAKKEAVLVSSNLDDETKDYIKQVVDNYFNASAASVKDLENLKGQVELLRKSMSDLKTETVVNNVKVSTKLEDINEKLSNLDNNDSEELSELKTEMISLKAAVSAIPYGNPGEEGSQAQVILQQTKEIELLKQEIDRLRTELKEEKNRMSPENLEKFDALMEENFRLQNLVKSQQAEIDALKEQVELLKMNIGDSRKLDMIVKRLDEVQAENEKTQIIESMNDLDILEAKNDANKKINKLSKEVDDLRSLVAKGTVIEIRGEPMFNTRMGGYFIVIASRRTQKAIEMAQQDFNRKGLTTKIEKNESGTWYHLVADRFETRKEAGKAVKELRDKGFDGVWWMYKEQEK